jgi:hypothetical protein
MKDETYKIIIRDSKSQTTVETTITAKRYQDAKLMAESMYGGKNITITII